MHQEGEVIPEVPGDEEVPAHVLPPGSDDVAGLTWYAIREGIVQP